MPTVAAQLPDTRVHAQNRRAVQTPIKISPRSFPVMPLGTPIIQRNVSCACGGSCPRCQAKSNLAISQPNDPAEIEADAIADKVMRMPEKDLSTVETD